MCLCACDKGGCSMALVLAVLAVVGVAALVLIVFVRWVAALRALSLNLENVAASSEVAERDVLGVVRVSGRMDASLSQETMVRVRAWLCGDKLAEELAEEVADEEAGDGATAWILASMALSLRQAGLEEAASEVSARALAARSLTASASAARTSALASKAAVDELAGSYRLMAAAFTIMYVVLSMWVVVLTATTVLV